MSNEFQVEISTTDALRKIMYADDLVIVAEHREELKGALEEWNEMFKKHGLKMNLSSSRRYTDFARATTQIQYLYPEPYAAARTKSQQANHATFYNFAERISFSEHWKLVAESSEFHLTLNRADFFQLKICTHKIGTF